MSQTDFTARDSVPHCRCLEEALVLAERLQALAEEGFTEAEDDACVELYGLVLDCAFRIQRAAENEKRLHLLRARANGGDPATSS